MNMPEPLVEQRLGDKFVITDNFNRLVRNVRWLASMYFNPYHFTVGGGQPPCISLASPIQGASAQLADGSGAAVGGFVAATFPEAVNSNETVVKADAAFNNITIKRTAWYTVSVGLYASLAAQYSATGASVNMVVYRKPKGGVDVATTLRVKFGFVNFTPIPSFSATITPTLSRQLDTKLNLDDVLTAQYQLVGISTYTTARLTVKYIHD